MRGLGPSLMPMPACSSATSNPRCTASATRTWIWRSKPVPTWRSIPCRRATSNAWGILRTLETRNQAQSRHYTDYYRALISVRSFEQAKQFAGRHSLADVETIPTITRLAPGTIPAAWRVHPTRSEIIREPLALPDGVQVLVIGHPLCHFTQDAARHISADTSLQRVLAGALWLAPQSRTLDIQAVQDWNRQYPEMKIRLVDRRDDWPQLQTWGTPTFYFLRDGQVVETVAGWPQEGRRSELLQAWARIKDKKAVVDKSDPRPAMP